MTKSSKNVLMNYLDLFKYRDRIHRTKHICLFLLWTLICYICDAFISNGTSFLLEILILIIISLIFINVICLTIRRLHDFNFRGWWLLFTAVPILGFIWCILIFIIPGTKGNNRFGKPIVAEYKKDIVLSILFALFILFFFGHQHYKEKYDMQEYLSHPEVNDLYIIANEKINLSDEENRDICNTCENILKNLLGTSFFNQIIYYFNNAEFYRAIKIEKLYSSRIDFRVGSCLYNDPYSLLEASLDEQESCCCFSTDIISFQNNQLNEMLLKGEIKLIKRLKK